MFAAGHSVLAVTGAVRRSLAMLPCTPPFPCHGASRQGLARQTNRTKDLLGPRRLSRRSCAWASCRITAAAAVACSPRC
eukprot:366055-Chlamydomonas_euryale.AAC.3